MIPDYVKEQIRDADLVAILQNEGLELKREGKYFKCCCPFHNEKTPSFVVHPAKNIATCFGEGRSWDAIGFVMERNKMTFYEAVEYLAEKLHIQYEKREPTPEEREAQFKKEQLIAVNKAAQEYFVDSFKKAPAAEDYCKRRGWKDDTIKEFGIGYAPKGGGLLKALTSAGWKREYLKEAGLIAVNEEDGSYYDAFRERIMFPIYSKSGYIAGFTGRYIGDKENIAKYKNTAETILFKKGEMLFGWFQARRSSKTNGTVVLCEGNPDVIRLHQIEVNNAIAPMGTALTDANIEYLKQYAQTVIIAGDMDAAGRAAAEKQGEALLKAGFKVRIIEWPEYNIGSKEGLKDPDEYFKLYPARWEETLTTNTQDYIPWIAARKMEGKTSQTDAAAAITEICQLMSYCTDSSAVEMYLAKFGKEYKYPKIWDKEYYTAKNARQRQEEAVSDKSREMLKEYGFYVRDNCYYGAASNSADRRWSNFILIPVLHIRDEKNAKRIYKIVNQKRQESVIKFNQSELVSFADFKTRVETAGNYVWEVTASELTQLKKYLYDDTPSADEVKQLGWQKRYGIYAWGNGCLDGDQFIQADKFGIVTIGEHRYYLPGMAADTYANTQAYMLDRRFTYAVTNNISLGEYSRKLCGVFGENAKVALCFLVATLFKDLVTEATINFPILNLFGPKGTGKSALGHSLTAFFVTGSIEAPNISGSTKAALAEAVAEVSNAIVHLEEYRQDIDIDRREFLKAIWDGQGRTKMDMDNNKKRVTTAVDSGVIISGQQMLTHPDIALFNRVVFLPFSKTTFDDRERAAYEELKRIERRGLSHLTGQILQLRNKFQGGFRMAWEDAQADMNKRVRSYGIEDRTFKNWCTVLAAYKVLESSLDFPFDYKEILEICARMCIDQNGKTKQNSELSGFWETVENLMVASKIWISVDYKIKDGSKPIKTKEARRNGSEFIPHADRRYLFINFKKISGLYQKEGRDTQNKTLPSDTLKYYLEHSPEYIGTCEKVKFKMIENPTGYINPQKVQTKVTTAMVFDYDSIVDNYGVNLDVHLSVSDNDDDDESPAPAPPRPVQIETASMFDDEDLPEA